MTRHFLTFLLVVFFLQPTLVFGQGGHYQYEEKDRDGIKVTGRIYHPASGKAVVEVWPRPFKRNPKVNKATLVSPSGKKYRIKGLKTFPIKELESRRIQYQQSSMPSTEHKNMLAFLDDLFIPRAYASYSNEDSSSESDSSDDDGMEDAAAFAGFGLLAGMAATMDKHWVTSGSVEVEEEAGEWTLQVEVLDEKKRKVRFSIPFELDRIIVSEGVDLKTEASETEANLTLSTDSDFTHEASSTDEDGNTITVKKRKDGSTIVIITDPDGNVISSVTRPPRKPKDPNTTTTYDPKTGITVTTTHNPDGSVTTTARDKNGNWVTGHRWPGGRKKPKPQPQPAPEPEPEPPPEPEPESETEPEPEPPPEPEIPPESEEELDPEPEPDLYGEVVQEENYPIGILLERDDDSWVPEYDSRTTVTAQIYEKPDNSYEWVISDEERYITTLFDRRSHEPGRALNRDLNRTREDSPDVFMSSARNPDCHCDEDEGTGYANGQCKTNDEENRFTFVVSSEDYGSFSKMMATCPDCVQLMRLGNGKVVEANIPAEQHLRDVPMDENENQIADGYPPDLMDNPAASDDRDQLPTGDGTEGDGFSAYEEYRGFFDKARSHLRSDWNKKDLFVDNPPGLPGLGTFASASGLDVHEIDASGHKQRVVNYNHHHAHVVDQHGLIIVALSSGGPLGYVDRLGPPKRVPAVNVIPSNHGGSYTVHDTVVHETGHAVGMPHHGNSSTWRESWYPPGTWRDNLSWFYNIHTGTMLCGYILPDDVLFGAKHNQSSGVVDCYMRYEYHGEAFRQASGTIDCIGFHPGFTQFCNTTSGTGFNAGNRVAGNATNGDCKGHIIVNDA